MEVVSPSSTCSTSGTTAVWETKLAPIFNSVTAFVSLNLSLCHSHTMWIQADTSYTCKGQLKCCHKEYNYNISRFCVVTKAASWKTTSGSITTLNHLGFRDFPSSSTPIYTIWIQLDGACPWIAIIQSFCIFSNSFKPGLWLGLSRDLSVPGCFETILGRFSHCLEMMTALQGNKLSQLLYVYVVCHMFSCFIFKTRLSRTWLH